MPPTPRRRHRNHQRLELEAWLYIYILAYIPESQIGCSKGKTTTYITYCYYCICKFKGYCIHVDLPQKPLLPVGALFCLHVLSLRSMPQHFFTRFGTHVHKKTNGRPRPERAPTCRAGSRNQLSSDQPCARSQLARLASATTIRPVVRRRWWTTTSVTLGRVRTRDQRRRAPFLLCFLFCTRIYFPQVMRQCVLPSLDA